MKAYSQDLRDRVIAARDLGESTKQVAKTFGVAASWVRRVMQTRRETGRTTPLPAGGRRFGKIDPVRLHELWEQKKDRTLEEYRQLLAEQGVHVCGQSISSWLIKLGLRYKKSR